jgi:amino acid transporter
MALDEMTDAKGLEVSSAEQRRRLTDKVRFRNNVNALRGEHHSDEESNEEIQESEMPDLKRQLKDRHLQMIAIGQ